MHHLNDTSGTLTLIGSGEFTPGMARIHRQIMALIDGPVRPVFIDTPAGFELNVAAIGAKAARYFADHFDLTLEVASFPHAPSATPQAMVAAMRLLRRATYLLSGPGSPTYAVRNWRNTPIFETMAGMLAAGAQLVMASAATLAMGRLTIPVYEIYKVGEEPHWVPGLDLLGRYGLDLAIVPHWNNSSGATHDTSRCFIGQPRFSALEAMLPPSTTVLGVDEYTACLLHLRQQQCEVIGAGGVTVRRAGEGQRFPSGSCFSFDLLRGDQPPEASLPPGAAALLDTAAASYDQFRHALAAHEAAHAVGHIHALIETNRLATERGLPTTARDQVAVTIREMLAALAIWLEAHTLGASDAAPPALDPEPLVETLIAARRELRRAKQWALADLLRDSLSTQGILLEDTREGTTWHLEANS